jgi:Zn-finger nucleic acid-binding protein
MPELTLRCPGCGAPTAADAVACEYCGSALATVACASCFAPMFRGSRFCALCGAEARRELLDDAKPLDCPLCHEGMQALLLGATEVRECAACGGLWADPGTLQRLSDAREAHADVVSVLATRLVTNVVATEVIRYVPCPCCAKLMNRTNFAKSSGIILDVCKNHGVWFNRGELQRMLQFVSGGGLARARAREHEQLVEERRRLEALQNSPGHTGGGVVINMPQTAPEQREHAAVIAHVLMDAVGLFLRR